MEVECMEFRVKGMNEQESCLSLLSYQIAVRYAQKNNLDGVAFTLTGGIVFIDMDEVGNKPIEIRKILASLSHEL